jgi:isoleucyl-tRNA synthetase
MQAMDADYLFVADLDMCSCIAQKLEDIEHIYPFCERRRMQIAVREIEGWYVAGLSDENRQQLGIPPFPDTNSMTKEQFNRFIPVKSSRRDFMNELLKRFSVQTARRKNNSFNRFIKTHLAEA